MKQLAYKDRAIRRSKYIMKNRLYRQPQITKRKYGKSITAKLKFYTSGNINSVTDYAQAYGLVALMQSSNDWANYRDSYALFNILNVTVKIFTNPPDYTLGVTRVAGWCYDVKDSAALTNVNQVSDHAQHILVNFMGSPTEYVFSAKTKAIGAVPQSTGVSTETWGWIKGFAESGDFTTLSSDRTFCTIQFIITVSFSQEQ